MKDDWIAESLARQADALIRDEVVTSELLVGQPEEQLELDSLFRLATAIKKALVPVAVPAFRADLHRALVFQAPTPISIGRPPTRYKTVVMAAAATGSLLSIAGLSLIMVRRRRNSSEPVATVV